MKAALLILCLLPCFARSTTLELAPSGNSPNDFSYNIHNYLWHGGADAIMTETLHPVLSLGILPSGKHLTPLEIFCTERSICFTMQLGYQAIFHDTIYWDRIVAGTVVGTILSAELDFPLGHGLVPCGKPVVRVR